MARAIIAIALAPSSGAIPACAALPTNRAVKRRGPRRAGHHIAYPPARVEHDAHPRLDRGGVEGLRALVPNVLADGEHHVDWRMVDPGRVRRAQRLDDGRHARLVVRAQHARPVRPDRLVVDQRRHPGGWTHGVHVRVQHHRATGGAAAWPAAHDVPDRVLLERDPQRLENRPDDRRHPLLVAEVAVHRAHPHEQIEHAVEVDHPVVGLRVHGVDVSRGCGRRHCVPSTTDEASVATVRVPMRRRLRQMPPTPVDRLV